MAVIDPSVKTTVVEPLCFDEAAETSSKSKKSQQALNEKAHACLNIVTKYFRGSPLLPTTARLVITSAVAEAVPPAPVAKAKG